MVAKVRELKAEGWKQREIAEALGRPRALHFLNAAHGKPASNALGGLVETLKGGSDEVSDRSLSPAGFDALAGRVHARARRDRGAQRRAGVELAHGVDSGELRARARA
ncbi:MAG: hypothetical protein KC492_45285 [Myxococcales bacterium]|nr:hypothetical protein [Myxococcales bacterium]MCB9610599.1 hypothetical protein [Polyangiaceae bacterium]